MRTKRNSGEMADFAFADGRVSIDMSGVGMRLETHTDGLPVAVPDEDVDRLSAAMVRATMEQLRR